MSAMTADGYAYAFDPHACASCRGRCCSGESGYIWTTVAEMEAIAGFLGLPFKDFVRDYVVQIGTKFSLREIRRQGEYECLFFDTEKRNCAIYPVRPLQCRTFPFWEYFKDHVDEVVRECPGIIISQPSLH